LNAAVTGFSCHLCNKIVTVFFLLRLEEANERYNQRESKPEDLELIEQLRQEVAEREMRIKQLIVSTRVIFVS
jgi:hypothetical protein